MENSAAQSAQLSPRRRSRAQLLYFALAAAAVIGVSTIFAWPRIYDAIRDVRAAAMLHSDNADERMKGAWITTPQSAAASFELLRGRLGTDSGEGDEACREAYLYALGRLAAASDFDLAQRCAGRDISGRVRAAAWLAMAKIDPVRFKVWEKAQPSPTTLWERVGATQVRLAFEDFSDVSALFEAGLTDDRALQTAASRALNRAVRPLLEIAGVWPLAARPPEGEIWGKDLIRELEHRTGAVALQTIYDASRQHLAAAERAQRNVRRLTGAREQIRRILFRD